MRYQWKINLETINFIQINANLFQNRDVSRRNTLRSELSFMGLFYINEVFQFMY